MPYAVFSVKAWLHPLEGVGGQGLEGLGENSRLKLFIAHVRSVEVIGLHVMRMTPDPNVSAGPN